MDPRIHKDFKDGLQFLLQGVSEFDVQGEALASEVVAQGPLAFPIALTPSGGAFIAGAYYGQGRIIMAAHESFLGRESLSTFLINAIRWLDEGRNGVIGIIPQLHAAHEVLSKSGLNCQITQFRKDLSVYVCTSYNDSQCHQIQEFVAEGGGLMIGGHAWYWAQCNPTRNVMTDCPGNRILSKMGLCLKANILEGGLYKVQQAQLDYCALMRGIQELDFCGTAVPCDLVLTGNHAFPLAMNPSGQVLMAASRYGQGRIVVLGHEVYLIRFPDLMENALTWLMPSESDNKTVRIQRSVSSITQNLPYSRMKTEVGDFQNGGFAVYVTDAYGVGSCAKELVAFLKSGGGLLIGGHAWHWAYTHPEENTRLCFPGNKVCGVAGIYFSEITAEVGKFSVPRLIPSSWLAVSIREDFKDHLQFLLQGVSEFDVQGEALASEVMAQGPLAFPIALTPSGGAFIAGAYYGQGRIIVAAHESFLGRESLSTFLINAIRWLNEGRDGVIGIIPELKSAHQVLIKSGLNCQITQFRKDLSVYVCTSYNDSQCHQIQEFVAEGGGLMIGGHAWYWAQCNPTRNVMTDCPGNRILSKMGLCLKANILEGGLYKVQQAQLDYCALMRGIQELDFCGTAVPCDLVLTGNHAFPLAMNPSGQVLMAASRYGQGRIVVLGHEVYLIRFPDLMENALTWLMPSESDNKTVRIQRSVSSITQNLPYSRMKTEVGDFQNGDFAVYVTDAYSVGSCAKELVSFLKSGGGLLIGGHAWHWAYTHPEENPLLCFPGNKVCSVAGIYFSEITAEVGIFSVPRQIPSSWLAVSVRKYFRDDLEFLLQGVSEFDVQGEALASEVMAHGPLAFPIALTPSGGAFIAGAYYGQGRIIVAAHESFLGRESLSTFLINAIRWLDEGRNGVIGIIPELQAAHRVLSKSGLNCQITQFRKDLSVYVCTSYNDSQCHQIQEFVAEGGGLMIGGHAWYWAQSNPTRNVMTDCPGNRILSKMGLCLKANILEGGLYKAQQTTKGGDIGTQAYHFRDLLQRFAGHVIKGQNLSKHEKECLQRLRSDCTNYLRMQAHDSASYTSVVALLTDMIKKVGVPQVCHKCPVQNSKDKLLLDVGSEVYKVCQDPDALLPFIIKDIPNLPTVSNARVRISAETSDSEEWISTGLYLSPGMKTYIEAPPEIKGKGWQVQIGCQTDCLDHVDVLERAAVVHKRFALETEMLQVWNLWGGLIYLIAPPKSKVDGVEFVFKTAVQAPYYKSGKTSVEDWVKNIRNAPAPWAELEFENVIITLHSKFIRKLDRPNKVADLWDSIMKGVADLAAKPAKFPRKERFVADVQISCGFMHAGYPVMIHSTSAAELLNPVIARTQGIWGAIHELGHNQQCSAWEFPPHTTECTCNLWSVYVHEEVLGVNRAKAHPNMTPEKRRDRTKSYVQGGRNLDSWSVWTALETYIQLQEKVGWDAFKKVFAAYHSIKNVPNDRDGKMNLYAVTFSKVVNMNLAPFLKAWGWPIQPSTEETLSNLPMWSDHPMTQYA